MTRTTNRWTRVPIHRDVSHHDWSGDAFVKSRRRVNFYEAGSGQEVIRVDWFTLLFKVTRVSHRGGALLSWPQSTVRRSSFSTTRFALKLTRELFVISIIPNLLSDHLTNTFDCYKA